MSHPVPPHGITGVRSSPSGGNGVSVGVGAGSNVGLSTGNGVSVTSGTGITRGVGDSVGAGVGDGMLVGVLVGRDVGDTKGLGVTVGITGSGVKVAKGVGVANGVSVLVGVELGVGVPGVFVGVGVLVGVSVLVEVGTGVREGRGGLVLVGVPGPTVSLSSGSSSSKPGGSVPNGVGVNSALGLSSFSERLHAASRNKDSAPTRTTQHAARTRLWWRPIQRRSIDISTTITHAPPTFNFPAGLAERRMVTCLKPLNDWRLHAGTDASRGGPP